MNHWPVGVFVVVLVVGILAFNGAIWGVLLARMQRRMRRFSAQWAAQGVVIRKGPEWTNYLGRASDRFRVAGSGMLVLTDHDLRAVLISPNREHTIPLAQIMHVEQRRTWGGRYQVGRPVIVVHFRDTGTAQDDVIGFSLRHASAWLEAINAAADAIR